MSLMRAARLLEKDRPFIGKSEAEYTEAILNSISAVLRVRSQVGVHQFHRMAPLDPALILTEPAFFRHAYRRFKPQGPLEEKVVAKTLRLLQSQKGLYNQFKKEDLHDLMKSRVAQMLISARQSELETHTLGVGLKAAQTCSGVMRLSPGVNHIFAALSAYARSVRSQKMSARLKSRRLFENIQTALEKPVGDERIEYIKKTGG